MYYLVVFSEITFLKFIVYGPGFTFRLQFMVRSFVNSIGITKITG